MRNRLLIYLKKYFAIFQNFSFAKGSCELEKGKRSIVMATANFQYCYYSNCAHPPLETARFFFCCPLASFCTNISELWQSSLKNFDKLNVENAEEKEKTAKPHKKAQCGGVAMAKFPFWDGGHEEKKRLRRHGNCERFETWHRRGLAAL